MISIAAQPRQVAHNIYKLYVLQMLQTALTGIPLIVLFVQENGVSFRQFLLLQVGFAIGMTLLEIPSGYLSDYFGRKRTLVAAAIASVIGVTCYALGSSFWHFLMAELFFAIFISFNSGTIEAIVYDSLLENDEVERSRWIFSHLFFVNLTTHAVASVLGGFIADFWSLRAAVAAQVPFMAAGFFVTLTLVEPNRHKPIGATHAGAMREACARALVHNEKLRGVILVAAVISTVTLSLTWLSQPYQQKAGLPVAWFGVTHGAIILAGAFASKMVGASQRRLGDFAWLVAIACVVFGSAFALSWTTSLAGLLFLLLGRASWGALAPLTSDMINKMTDSDLRATVLSVRSFVMRLVFSISAPMLGYVNDAYSLQQAFFWAAIVGGAATLLGLVHLARALGRQ